MLELVTLLITSVEQHQAATYDFGCSKEVLFIGGSFSMVNVTARGHFLPIERGSRLLEVPLVEIIQYDSMLLFASIHITPFHPLFFPSIIQRTNHIHFV